MDVLDLQILKILQQNARASLKEISSKIHLSVPAVSSRISKLENDGCIKGYVTLIEIKNSTIPLTTYTLLKFVNQNLKLSTAFGTFISDAKEVLECSRLTGDYDYLLKIVTKDTQELDDFLTDLREKWTIERSVSYNALSNLKDHLDYKF